MFPSLFCENWADFALHNCLQGVKSSIKLKKIRRIICILLVCMCNQFFGHLVEHDFHHNCYPSDKYPRGLINVVGTWNILQVKLL
mgnify:CR=1 FL=1